MKKTIAYIVVCLMLLPVWAMADVVFPSGGGGGGTSTGDIATDLSLTNQATGDLTYFNGTNWVRLAKGTQGQAFIMGASIPGWSSSIQLQQGDNEAQIKGSTAGHLGLYKVDLAGSTTDKTRTIVSSQTDNRSNTIPDMSGAFVISGGPMTFDETVKASTDDLTATQVSRGFINNYGQNAPALLTLPAAAEGLSFVAIVGAKTANDWEFHHNGAETIYTDIGGTLTAGRAGIKCNNQEVGSRMSCSTFQTGAATWSWLCGAVSGTWTAVAP